MNQRLNIATTDLENAKRELASAQTAARENEEEAQSLAVKVCKFSLRSLTHETPNENDVSLIQYY